ncbi:hypothetical protein Tco_1480674, partial [Tanacetum coccineum]
MDRRTRRSAGCLDIGCLDVDIESCNHGGKEAFVESSVESSSGGLDSMNSGEMQGKEDS